MDFTKPTTKADAIHQLTVWHDMALGYLYNDFKAKWLEDDLVSREDIKELESTFNN